MSKTEKCLEIGERLLTPHGPGRITAILLHDYKPIRVLLSTGYFHDYYESECERVPSVRTIIKELESISKKLRYLVSHKEERCGAMLEMLADRQDKIVRLLRDCEVEGLV